jgi:hypothetical protein
MAGSALITGASNGAAQQSAGNEQVSLNLPLDILR